MKFCILLTTVTCTWSSPQPDSELVQVSDAHADALHWLTKMVSNRMHRSNHEDPVSFAATSNDDVLPSHDVRDCQMSDWSAWTACSQTCGTGFQARSRLVLEEESGGGVACANVSMEASRHCEPPLANCPIDCAWADWTSWSDCGPDSCSGSNMSRSRAIAVRALYNGAECSNENTQSQACAEAVTYCADCSWNTWGDWGRCQYSCSDVAASRTGRGARNRYRTYETLQAGTGQHCVGNNMQSDASACGQLLACPTSCMLSHWTPWAAAICDVTCGTGSRKISRVVIPPVFGGLPCCNATYNAPGSCMNINTTQANLVNIQDCTLQPCDCIISQWTPWGPCTPEIHGNRSRTRTASSTSGQPSDLCLKAALCSDCVSSPGLADEVIHQSWRCNTTETNLIRDCQYQEWEKWSNCAVVFDTAPCASTRLRAVSQPALNGGKDCDPNLMKQSLPCAGAIAGCRKPSPFLMDSSIISSTFGKIITFADGSKAKYTLLTNGRAMASFDNGTVIYADEDAENNAASIWYTPVFGDDLQNLALKS